MSFSDLAKFGGGGGLGDLTKSFDPSFLRQLKTTPGGSSVFNPEALVAKIRQFTPEFDDEGRPTKPGAVSSALRNFAADIAHSVFSVFDPSDDDLYMNSRFLIIITSAGIAVCTGQLYLMSNYANENKTLISPEINSGLSLGMGVGALATFFNLLIWAYLAKKGVKSYDKATVRFFSVFNFILSLAVSGVASLTRRVLDGIISRPQVLAQYDASVIRVIDANFSRAQRIINWMIFWNGLLMVYFIGGEWVRYYLAE
jgi:hypothetical protein